MRTLPILAVIALAIGNARALDPASWRHEQAIVVTAPGLVRLDVPPETMQAAAPQLADLRLLSPSGAESPYVVEWPVSAAPREVPVRTFKAGLGDQSTVLEIETGTADAIEAVILETPATSFIKAARLEGSSDGATWHDLAAREVIFRQNSGANRLRIPFATGSWKHLRVTVDDRRNNPVPFTAARVVLARTKAAAVPHPVAIAQREERPQQTRLTLDLGAAHLPLATLKLAVGDAVFSRRATVSWLRDNRGQVVETFLGNAAIYRVTSDGLSSASLEIPVHREVPEARLIVTIQNGDSPPLNITGIEAERHPVALLFYATEAGTWKLLSGNAGAAAPDYDLAALKQELSKATGARLNSGALVANPNFKAAPALPGVQPGGAHIDLAPWRFRRPITIRQTGVIRLELDPGTLAHAQASLDDLRVVQNDRQIPFLLDHTNATRAMQPVLSKDSDPKRRMVSLWRVTMPLDGLPATSLTITSPTPLFERTIEVWAKAKDAMGNEARVHLGSAPWTRSAGGRNERLAVPLTATRVPEVFFIETNNGDNPPIEIENVEVHHAVSAIVAKITDEAPVHLYYGNDSAYAPRYDLQLVRADLLRAQTENAALGKEETLRAAKRTGGEPNAGSPWLWGALALVVVVLLWVVARMLPKATP